jgi:hypothetical protein
LRKSEWQYRALYLDQKAVETIAKQLGIAEKTRLLMKPGLHYGAEMTSLL